MFPMNRLLNPIPPGPRVQLCCLATTKARLVSGTQIEKNETPHPPTQTNNYNIVIQSGYSLKPIHKTLRTIKQSCLSSLPEETRTQITQPPPHEPYNNKPGNDKTSFTELGVPRKGGEAEGAAWTRHHTSPCGSDSSGPGVSTHSCNMEGLRSEPCIFELLCLYLHHSGEHLT